MNKEDLVGNYEPIQRDELPLELRKLFDRMMLEQAANRCGITSPQLKDATFKFHYEHNKFLNSKTQTSSGEI